MYASLQSELFAADIGMVPELDLHEERPEHVRDVLETFLHVELVRKTDAVKIIHGRGAGVLSRIVQSVLKEYKEKHHLVRAFAGSEQLEQAGAVTIVLLERIGRRIG